mmetsp:Transcript_35570/g.49387  ORF Transcript_35570/g.49387 Transcript_35570/m.49387 type:complete len:81 (+) Transcript_35570:250-492(+)
MVLVLVLVLGLGLVLGLVLGLELGLVLVLGLGLELKLVLGLGRGPTEGRRSMPQTAAERRLEGDARGTTAADCRKYSLGR